MTPNMRVLRDEYGFDTLLARRQLLAHARRICGKDVLDIGAGCGGMAIVLAENGFRVVSVDIDPSSLRYARRRASKAGARTSRRICFMRADAVRLPFPAGAFDAVLSFGSMHHMPDCRQVIEEMVRVCKRTGVLAIADLNRRGLAAVRTENARHGHTHDENECRMSAIGRILGNGELRVRRHDLEFVTVYIARLRPWPGGKGCGRDGPLARAGRPRKSRRVNRQDNAAVRAGRGRQDRRALTGVL
jgi:SAM-dependent methyltransferase